MGTPRPSPEVEAFARELCASEGWDPDERIGCDEDEVALAERCPVTGRWSCARWQAYAGAAERLAKASADDWNTF
ncbi:MAG TPA: hypothetical protein VJS38_11015 [Phenylobacterium sp.]|uniref:hypothetical protein n=1 Tax=Phenylobacterium sp. TaxID=1871053 RepID=UPI002B46A963|nr:hypothetical protein [Phenylobacterium sp.]HKR88692.1 hypothetical protein [Phenylobacterium sp.]